MLEVQGVTVRFGGVTPLDDVSLVAADRVCGLIGPNGAGKTTLLNVLCGFVQPVAGRVASDGQDLLSLSPHRRARWGLRRTFQSSRLVETASSYSNVLTAAENCGVPDGGVTAPAALDFVGLHDARQTTASALSSYQRKCLELARALVGRPHLVLLDEPAAGLAPAETTQLAALIGGVQELSGALVLLIDHDVDLVRAVCGSLTVLDFGKVIAAGPTAEVLDSPEVRRAYLGAEEL